MSDHWYHIDGRACHTVPRTKGDGERPTTLADARKLKLLPSVTTILNIVDKPQLTQWKLTEALKLAYREPPADGEGPEDYASRIIERSYDETAGAAADEGSLIHAAIEAHYKGEPVPEAYQPHVEATVEAVHRHFPHVDDWVPEQRVVAWTGFAGTCDLHSPSHKVVVDFKCKAFDHYNAKKLAFDQVRQLAAYGQALYWGDWNAYDTTPRCANVFVSRTHPGHVLVHEWSVDEIEKGLDRFHVAFALWQLERDYRPKEAFRAGE